MKIWLNDLKPGDTFYENSSIGVHHYKVIGDAHNMNFKMSRFSVLDLNSNKETELFVNHYVYDNYNECKENLLEKLRNKLNTSMNMLVEAQNTYETLKLLIKKIENGQSDNS